MKPSLMRTSAGLALPRLLAGRLLALEAAVDHRVRPVRERDEHHGVDEAEERRAVEKERDDDACDQPPGQTPPERPVPGRRVRSVVLALARSSRPRATPRGRLRRRPR